MLSHSLSPGHDFYVLAQDVGTFDADTVTLDLSNPPRRDTATLPGGGYLVIAFLSDNPGVWLMHCHIGWHVSEGFALEVVERQSEFGSVIDTSVMNETCSTWDTYQDTSNIEEDDSGV